MIRTRFSPELDGASDWALSPLDSLSGRQVARLYEQARGQALEGLHAGYYDAVEKYRLAQYMGRWLEGSELALCARRAGQVYATLDYYHACLPVPGEIAGLSARQRAVFEAYFYQRSRDNLLVNAGDLLCGMAITSLIPDEWFPRGELEKVIESEIRELGMFTPGPDGLTAELYTVEAAVRGDREAALQALMAHPLGPGSREDLPAGMDKWEFGQIVLDDLLETNRAWLPQFFRAK